ncbi:MAG: hypothetical protein PHO56_04505 [Patescibacteria group bacterium]|nr:hypothetical protein [Patescibacteria group bacterium]
MITLKDVKQGLVIVVITLLIGVLGIIVNLEVSKSVTNKSTHAGDNNSSVDSGVTKNATK